jgi:hypothetical protein
MTSNEHFYELFCQAMWIVRGYRRWFHDLTNKFPDTHPAVIEAYKLTMPHNWQQLLLEWPHRSETDASRIAYTRDERSGENDRQTITTVGKYLARHFDLPDHVIRDLTARHTAAGQTFKFLNTTVDMVDAVNNGPYSCMCWRNRDNVRCSDNHYRHPYEVYDPKYGWHMAVRINGESIDGRALCNTDSSDQKYFVRSYKRDPNGGYSYSDEFLEAWLKAQGYEHYGAWDYGTKLAHIATNCEFLAPYIDGNRRDVDICRNGNEVWLEISDSGDYTCDNTDGEPDGVNRTTCDDCGEYCDEDDMYWTGTGEDNHVCQCCIDNYLYAYSRRGYQYYINSDYCVYVESQDEHYDEDYLHDNNIVRLENGEFEHTDNAVEIDGDWYHNEDDDIVFDEYNDRYQLTDNCTHTEDMGYVHTDNVWQCQATYLYYSDNIESVEVNGETYHPDNAPETESNEE